MEVLRTAVSLLSIYDADEGLASSHAANLRKSFRLTAQISHDRRHLRSHPQGQAHRRSRPRASPTPPTSSGCSTAKSPPSTATRAFDIALILHADHELNASTFAARVIAATLSPTCTPLSPEPSAPQSPLHGGANEATMKLLFAIDEKAGEDPVEHVRGMFARKEKDLRLRPSRLHHRRSPRHAPPPHVWRARQAPPATPSWFDMSSAKDRSLRQSPKRSSTPTSTSTPPAPTPPSALTSISSPPSSPSHASPAGPPTSWNSTTTTALSAPAPTTPAPPTRTLAPIETR